MSMVMIVMEVERMAAFTTGRVMAILTIVMRAVPIVGG